MSALATPEAATKGSSASPKPTAPRSGIIAALWIPFNQSGHVDRGALGRHLSWLEKRGMHGILGLGSTGEFARMDLGQRKNALEAIVELSAPMPVIANLSSIRLEDVISLGRDAKKMGAVGAALMPPPFFPMPQTDILEFFLRAAEAVDLPFYLYNYPEVTGNRIGPDVIRAFADQANMVGIKQSGGELSYHEELIAIGQEKNFSVFTAADPRLAEFLEKGAAGCLGGLGNFVPEYMLEIFNVCQQGRSANDTEASARLARVGEILSRLQLPHNVRSGMEARGFHPGAFKTVVSAETLAIYGETVENFRKVFAEWELPIYED